MKHFIYTCLIFMFGLSGPGWASNIRPVSGCQNPSAVAGPNLVQAPINLSDSSYFTNQVTSFQNQGYAPDGSNSLNILNDNAVNGSHYITPSGINAHLSGSYTVSVYLRQGTQQWVLVFIADKNTRANFGVVVDLASGTKTATTKLGSPKGTSSSISASSQSGMWIVTVSMYVAGNGANVYGGVALSDSGTPKYAASFGIINAPVYSGKGKYIYIWNLSLTYSIGEVCDPAPPPWVQAGYETNTFHVQAFNTTNVDVGLTRTAGYAFYLTGSFGYNDTTPDAIIFNSDGSLTIDGTKAKGSSQAIIYSVAAKASPPTAWHGQAFGGGGYFEATLSFDPSEVNENLGANGWPAWWADPVEHGAESPVGADDWQGQVRGYAHFTETDFFEYNVWSSANRLFQYTGTVIDWSGTYTGDRYPYAFQNSENRIITLPPGVDFAQPHRYGFLWVPATAVEQGYFQWYFDGKPTSARVSYGKYDCDKAPSPPASNASPWLYGVLDCQHLELILNPSYGGYLRIYSVDVWQASSAGNIVQ